MKSGGFLLNSTIPRSVETLRGYTSVTLTDMMICCRADSLKLFYAKRSQFVSGVEAEKVSVSVGQRVSILSILALIRIDAFIGHWRSYQGP